MNEELIKRIEKWCKELEQMGGQATMSGTWAGDAYGLFEAILAEEKERHLLPEDY